PAHQRRHSQSGPGDLPATTRQSKGAREDFVAVGKGDIVSYSIRISFYSPKSWCVGPLLRHAPRASLCRPLKAALTHRLYSVLRDNAIRTRAAPPRLRYLPKDV